MAQEIGVAYVSLLPSGKGFSKGVQNEAESAFKGAEKSSDGFFSNVTTWAKRGALVVGGMVASIGALAIGGGISRALNIEDATAKLKGLGHDTQVVEQIMTDALASVKGTAFGLDSAATLAASAVAAGIKPGRELERYLRLTADAATIAGVSLDELGSVMNNVTTLGAAYNDSLQILAQKGLPIYQWLAEEIGVTTDEVKNLASQGKISSETFRAAIENNIAGAALTAGDTTRGAFANMMASLSRLGVAFVGDGLSGAKTFFKEITVILDGLEERIGPWADRIQEKLGGLVQLDGMGDRFLSGLDSFLANFDATPLGLLLGALKPLIPVFEEIGKEIGPVLAATFTEIWKSIEPMVPLITGALVDAIVQLAPPLTELLVALLPLLPPLIQLVVEVLPLLIDLLELLIPGLIDTANNLTLLSDVFTSTLGLLSGDTTFQDLGVQVLGASGPVGFFAQSLYDMYMSVTGTLGRLGAFWGATWSNLGSFFSGIGTWIVSTAQSIWQRVPAEFQSGVTRAVAWVQALPGRIISVLSGAGSWLVSSGRALIQGFIDGINSMIGNVGNAIGGLMDWAAGFFPHSPAKRGPFSGPGWDEVFDGGESLMEQFARGATSFRPELNFGNITGSLQGVTAMGDTYVESPFTGEYLLARVRAEADARVGAYDTARSMATRGGVRR